MKGIYNDPGINDYSDVIDHLKLTVIRKDRLRFAYRSSFMKNKVGSDIKAINEDVCERDNYNQWEYGTVESKTNNSHHIEWQVTCMLWLICLLYWLQKHTLHSALKWIIFFFFIKILHKLVFVFDVKHSYSPDYGLNKGNHISWVYIKSQLVNTARGKTASSGEWLQNDEEKWRNHLNSQQIDKHEMMFQFLRLFVSCRVFKS